MASRILIVDDDPMIRMLLERKLSNLDYEVHTAATAEEALEKLPEVEPDLIISDIIMPGMGGVEFCHRVRQDERWFSIPFVFLSVKKGVHDRVVGLEAGGDDYLSKPFHLSELVARIEARLRVARRHARQEEEQPREAAEGEERPEAGSAGLPMPEFIRAPDRESFQEGMEFFKKGMFDVAYDIWNNMLKSGTTDTLVKQYAAIAWNRYRKKVFAAFGGEEGVPERTTSDTREIVGLELDTSEYYLWTKIDGRTNLKKLTYLSSLDVLRTYQLLMKLLENGLIRVRSDQSDAS
jgi:CheY-like chemotaxis protein